MGPFWKEMPRKLNPTSVLNICWVIVPGNYKETFLRQFLGPLLTIFLLRIVKNGCLLINSLRLLTYRGTAQLELPAVVKVSGWWDGCKAKRDSSCGLAPERGPPLVGKTLKEYDYEFWWAHFWGHLTHPFLGPFLGLCLFVPVFKFSAIMFRSIWCALLMWWFLFCFPKRIFEGMILHRLWFKGLWRMFFWTITKEKQPCKQAFHRHVCKAIVSVLGVLKLEIHTWGLALGTYAAHCYMGVYLFRSPFLGPLLGPFLLFFNRKMVPKMDPQKDNPPYPDGQ